MAWCLKCGEDLPPARNTECFTCEKEAHEEFERYFRAYQDMNKEK